MYSSGSAMLPSTDASASLRHTRRLRRQTGIQRSDSSGVRSSEAEYMQRRTNYLASITRTPDTGRRARRLGKEYRLRPAPPGKNFCLRARDRPEDPAVMSEAAVSNDEFTAFWNNVLVDKFERFRNILLDGLSYHSEAPLRTLEIAQGACALDVGCGWGDTAIALARKVGPSGSVLGLDCCDAFLEKGRLAHHLRDGKVYMQSSSWAVSARKPAA